MMISLKVLSTAAALALVLPAIAPSVSFAQAPPSKGLGGGGGFKAGGGGGGSPRMGGAGPQMGGGAFRGGGGPRPGPSMAVRPGPQFSGGGGGGYYRHGGGGGGFIPGAIAGAMIGGAIASGGGYYGAPGYPTNYYDDGYYVDGAVAVAPAPVDDESDAYCMQRYRSYDPNSGTYLGYDGYRHPCP
jgi:hypothetical protein